MKYAYLYLFAVPFILPLVIRLAVDAHRAKVRRREQIAEKERREAARREAMRVKQAEREAKKAAEEAEKVAMPKRKPGRPRKNPAPEQRPEIIPAAPVAQEIAPESAPNPPETPVTHKRPFVFTGNNAFVGESVAFTGTLPGMTRREAIEAVEKNGGRAYENMPAGTTILVVGDRPGKKKLDNADRWIGSCRKINAAEFFVMLKRQLTLEPEEFEAFYDAYIANNTHEEALA